MIDWSFLGTVTGVIHVGGHRAEERGIYQRAGVKVIWIEALPGQFARLVDNIKNLPDQVAFNALLTDRDGDVHDFNVSSNDASSSSIFTFAEHADLWPHVKMVRTRRLTSSRLDTLLAAKDIAGAEYQALVLDVQGAELLVLKGTGELFSNFRCVLCEAADFQAYRGAAQLLDLKEYLEPLGFKEAARYATAKHPRRGTYWDVLWQRSA